MEKQYGVLLLSFYRYRNFIFKSRLAAYFCVHDPSNNQPDDVLFIRFASCASQGK